MKCTLCCIYLSCAAQRNKVGLEMAVLFAVLYASVILPIVASRWHPPVLLHPVVEPYRVVEGSAATIQCTFGFPGSIFRVYRKVGETLVETKNVTTERQRIGTALSVKATVKGLPVSVNNIILRTLTEQTDHVDSNSEVEVLPTSAIPQLMAMRLDSGFFFALSHGLHCDTWHPHASRYSDLRAFCERGKDPQQLQSILQLQQRQDQR